MYFEDSIEKIYLKEELKNVKEQLKAVQDENTKLKTDIDLHCKANEEKRSILLERNEQIAKLIGDIHKLKGELKILKYSDSVLRKNVVECKSILNKVYGADSYKDGEGFGDGEINCSNEDFLRCQLSNREGKIEALKAKIEMLESDRKDSLKACCGCSHKFQDRIKDLETEIDQLKKNPSAAPDAEWIAIHTADVETINKLNIQVNDLNNTITTLLDRLSKSTDENQELKKKVQELKDIIKDLGAKLYK